MIDTSNNVGIGTAAPLTKLHLNNTTTNSILQILFTDATTGTTINDGFSLGKNTDSSVFLWSKENSFIHFATNDTERLRITAAGNVGIGNTAPIAPLCVGNSALANQDGFMVLGKCTTVGTSRQFRIGLNANFDLAIGDYGSNNVAGTWTQALRIAYGTSANTLFLSGVYSSF